LEKKSETARTGQPSKYIFKELPSKKIQIAGLYDPADGSGYRCNENHNDQSAEN
jgi:hypothetical protein